MTAKKHEVPEELLAKLLADYKKPEDLIGENGRKRSANDTLAPSMTAC